LDVDPEGRMKRTTAVAIVMCLAALVPSAALDVRIVSVGPAASVMLGYAAYELEATDITGTVYSRLDFPLDGWYAGALGEIILVPREGRPFVLDLWWQTSMTDPADPMKDGDWIDLVGAPKLKFSYTESEARASTTIVGVDLSRLVWITPVGRIAVGGGARFHTTDQDAIGIEGWQIPDLGGTNDVVDIDMPGVKGLTYRLTIVDAHALASLTQPFLSWLTGELTVYGGPAYFDDRDDHVLRNKLSTSSGFGIAGGARISVSAHPTGKGSKLRPRFSIFGDVYRAYADLDQKQEWYGDDGSTPEGTVITGVDHKIELFTLSAGISVVVEVQP
jgi:hypothetical protein